MAKQKSETKELSSTKIPNGFIAGFVILTILILFSIGFTYFSTNNLVNKIDSINKSLELESESHFQDVQKSIEQSVVAVISSPARNDDASNNVIYLDNKGQSWNLGTGFSFDNEGNILTANHVVQNANAVLVVRPMGQNSPPLKVKFRHSFPEFDLAILYVDYSSSPVIPSVKIQEGNFSNMNSYIGSSVAFFGFPVNAPDGGLVETTTRGSVSGLTGFTYDNQQVPVYIIGATANKGNSGGPVFSLKSGEVIGIINEKIVGKEGIAISTAINQNLIDYLKNAPI